MEKKLFTTKAVSVLFVLLSLTCVVQAQWNPDSSRNLGIAVTIGEQVTPKIVETTDGGCYISWFDNRNGNYCMYLQRLNSLGEAQWETNGLLISDHDQSSSLVDYDLTADQADNAVVVFTDLRNGSTNDLDVVAYKISPEGTFLWGPDGVGLSEAGNTDFEPAPMVTATTDGNFVFGWGKISPSNIYIICFQKVSADGQKQWGENGINISGSGSERLQSPDLAPAGGDTVIALWKNNTGQPWAPITHLITQKFAPDGSMAWDTAGVLIYDLGHMSAWTYPEIISDEFGGAYYAWYDSPTSAEFNVSVQHVDAGGNLIFPLNGVRASTNSSGLHMNPALCYSPFADAIFVFWVETNINQSQWGLYGQKFNIQGDRLWTDSGQEFVGLSSRQISYVRSQPGDSSIYVGYFEMPTVINTAVMAFRIDVGGTYYWEPRVLSIADLGSRDDLGMVVNTENRAFLTWYENRNGNYDVYAQNVNPDGSLGNPSTYVEETVPTTPISFKLNPAYPNPFNPTAILSFELPITSFVTLNVFDVTGRQVATLANGEYSAGIHKCNFDGKGLASGIFFYQLKAENFIDTKKMVLIK